MRGLILAVLLTLLLPVESWAAVSFFYRCDGTTLSATDDLPGADTSATLSGTSAINATAALAGSNGCQILAAGDTVRLDAETAVIDPSVGSLAFLFRVQTWTSGNSLIFIRGTTVTNNFYVNTIGSSGTGNLRFRINDGSGTAINLDLSANAIALNTTYYCDISWDQPANDRRIRVYTLAGSLVDSNEDTATAFTAPAELAQAAGDGMRFGEANGAGAGAFYLDNIFIGKAYADADTFFTNRSITSYTSYGGGGPAVNFFPRRLQVNP